MRAPVMESSIIFPTISISISKSIISSSSSSSCSSAVAVGALLLRRRFFSPSPSSLCYRSDIFSNLIRRKNLVSPSIQVRSISCLSNSSCGGGGQGFDDSGRRGGRGGGGGGFGRSPGSLGGLKSVAGETHDGADVIILDVGGMICGGCAANVKRILESQPQVSSASVNLATEAALVWAVPEDKVLHNWKQELGEKLANQLTSCGFKSSLRDAAKEDFNDVFQRKMAQKQQRLKESGRELAVSLALCAVCLLGHAVHIFGITAPSWIHALHSTRIHLSLSLFTFLGPGRMLILDGLRNFFKGNPNMNSLVGLGALSSFAVSCLATAIPKLGWKTFFEEPIMLLAFVLLGKNIEQRAKLRATSDMSGLLSILPTKARLLVKNDSDLQSSLVEVPCNSLAIGDHIVVLPGDRIPADGIVKAGRSTVDESSLTGEPMPVTKLPGLGWSAAGSINLNGTLTIEVKRQGGETAMGDIVRLVEEAQAREAPVQRLADKVAGHFTYGVMAFSAATFMFWKLLGTQLLPAATHQGSAVSLALQLSCSVLVVACPCALGLATPTAVLVGTSLGATKGLLLRGGDVLEKFATADTIVFDKTGTLTIGKPVLTKIMASSYQDNRDSGEKLRWTDSEILMFAAAVESNTNHPVGKAIVEAARASNCNYEKMVEGTFKEEPGSGAVAMVEQKIVTVGTLDWLRRHGVDHNALLDDEVNNQSVVYVGVDGNLAGRIYLEDKIREDAHQVVEYLSKQGISMFMLSGDRKSTAEHVASLVGIPKDKVISGVKPDEKKKFISELQRDQRVVAMVGDGINDAAALALSDIGIAMGEGVGAASDVSSIVLMRNKLSQLVDALELSKLTMKTVKQNLWWAFGYNIVGIPVAAGALLPLTGIMLTPSLAGALMGFSSVGVMANSLLLKMKLDSKKESFNKLQQKSRANPISDIVLKVQDSPEVHHPTKWKSV